MKTPLLNHLFRAAALLALAATPATAGESKIKFSDSAKPGQLVIQLGMGDVVIRGEDTDELVVESDDAAPDNEPRPDGLRRLDGGSGYSLSETDNVVTLTLANLMGGHRRDSTDVNVTVPRSTRIKMERVGPGDVEIHDVNGDLELRGTVGDIELHGVTGGVVVESVNGDVDAEFVALAAGRPVSINVVHGDVALRVPADARASVRFRTLRGEMLTDFSEAELVTRIENANTGTSRGSADEAPESPATPETAEARARDRANRDAAKAAADRAEAELERAEAEIERAEAQAEAAVAGIHVDVRPDVHVQVRMPPMPPMPPMPMAGGKLVVGTLNGGGTDLIVTTLTGDITLRKE